MIKDDRIIIYLVELDVGNGPIVVLVIVKWSRWAGCWVHLHEEDGDLLVLGVAPQVGYHLGARETRRPPVNEDLKRRRVSEPGQVVALIDTIRSHPTVVVSTTAT